MTAYEASIQYHIDCELFDRTVCTGGMGKDGVLPANGREQRIIEANALSRRAYYAKQVRMLTIDFDKFIRDNRVINEAIRKVATL